MSDYEFSHVGDFLLGRLVGRVVLVLLYGIDGLRKTSASPEEGRIVVVVVAAHTTRLFYHLLVTVVAYTELLRHNQAAINGGGTLGDGIGEELDGLELCQGLVVIRISRRPCGS